VSARLVVATGAAGAAVLVLGGLAMLGSTSTKVGMDGWTGWTGRPDSVAVSDKAAMTPDDAIALKLLERSAGAARTVAYTGEIVVQDGGETVTTTLVRVPGRGTVSTSSADGAEPVFAPDGRSGSFADEGRQLDLLGINYRVLREAGLDTTVAGRPAEAVVAVDGDGVLAARYWLDAETGLLLRKELLDDEGAVWSRTGFESFSTAVDAAVVDSAQAATPDDPWSQRLDAAGLKKARQAGCDCPEVLPGGLSLVETRRAPAGTLASVPLVHQLFSDGLVSVSLFTMEGELSDGDRDGLRARGFELADLDGLPAWVRGGDTAASTATAVWQCDSSVLTLVTDDAFAPMTVVRSVVTALPPTTSVEDASFWDKVRRGWDRVTGGSA
jgi:sigma-E factor negative regulatory protein RseB